MTRKHEEGYWSVLSEVAHSLTGGANLPIDVKDLCARLNVIVTRANVPSNKALLVNTARGAEIRIPPTTNAAGTSTARERFMIAHELGHLVLERHCGVRPLGTSEYWRHEHLADNFAGMLLVPDHIVMANMSCDYTSRELMTLTREMAAKARVMWITVGHRISWFEPRASFFNIIRTENGEFRVLHTTVTRGYKKKIPATSDLGKKLADLSEDAREVTLDDSVLSNALIPSSGRRLEGTATPPVSSTIHVAVLSERVG
jgi:hypothetical protein